MLDALCRRAPGVASTRRVAERCMVFLVFVGDVEIYSLLLGGDGYYYILHTTYYSIYNSSN